MIVGYARVSTDGQSLEVQQAALKAAGATKTYSEKISGAVSDRKALGKALKELQSDDVLLVTRLDRLARSTRDLLNILDTISKAGAKFRSLADAWADTTTPHGELMITILAGLATFERHLIKARTDEGRTRAKARGVKIRTQAQADAVPDQRSISEKRSRRGLGRYWSELRREPFDHIEALISPPGRWRFISDIAICNRRRYIRRLRRIGLRGTSGL